ncbi:hypothetical protein TNCV_265001 [Trichonephila clavipes]|nr:hypothetical protein TNCV_265001 [Trichonephila clavipes]
MTACLLYTSEGSPRRFYEGILWEGINKGDAAGNLARQKIDEPGPPVTNARNRSKWFPFLTCVSSYLDHAPALFPICNVGGRIAFEPQVLSGGWWKEKRDGRSLTTPGFFAQNWSGNEPNCSVTCIVLKAASVTLPFVMMNIVDLDLTFAYQKIDQRLGPLVVSHKLWGLGRDRQNFDFEPKSGQ